MSEPQRGADIPGTLLGEVHDAYLQWLGDDYDLGALNVVLCAAAAEKLSGDPPWVLVVGGSGAAKTETVAPLTGAGAVCVSTITGEAALLSGTPAKSRAKHATGGLLRKIGSSGLLLGLDRETAMRVAARCCHDTMPPLRRVVLADVADHPDSFTPDVVERIQVPKTTVDRTLQELQLLGLLEVDHVPWGEKVRWMYSLAPGIDPADLGRICSRNVSNPQRETP